MRHKMRHKQVPVLGSILNTKYLKCYFKYFLCICILNTVIESI